ncbi:sugar ABC transporter substrate-binding protein [Streptomyces indicus]|uniref:N,N'-diacetylchitobiose transport system substrate-binding protein n=1 Tax=Streptomyces indicus TaxID=417292 RepID=A0A1G8U906_9ACTN|nr:sugar ABC transporter substrate-binding protein [Streptomyces indicus]SDJ50094.1 N,N'-diacetylchitobiose transport system substrate-binding protein [Streptomyces indicus]
MKIVRFFAGAAALAVAASLSACGGSDDKGSGDGKGDGGRTTLDVWLMRDSVSEEFQTQFEKDFEKQHPKIDVKIQIQEWNGIGQKITAALASNDAPDVIEVGNTQVAQYAASGGVKDLSDKVSQLGGSDWIPGLAEPGKVDGKQYGIPYYAANRVVIYRTDLYEKAGIKQPPTTREEWLAATRKLNTGKQQGIYLPGQNWYTLAGFIWDEGGDLAVKEGDTWKGALDTPEALAGMEFYKELQSLGKGPKDSDEAEPPQVEVVAKGDVAQVIAVPGGAKLIEEANPELKGKLGFFPIPGKTADKPGAVFTGGSDLIIPEASGNPDEAYAFIKALAGDDAQKKLATAMSYVPNKKSLASVLASDPGASAMATGATNGRATPNSPEWAAVEANNPIKEFMTQVLTGADPKKAGADATEAVSKALGG